MRWEIRVGGIVQGVGFRPYLFRLAKGCGLSGFVLNDPGGVLAEVEGAPEKLKSFLTQLPLQAPPRALVKEVSCREIPSKRDKNFIILSSQGMGEPLPYICPDLATCPDCLQELMDPDNPRYRYPLINCTHCGPRFTLVEGLPYDRDKTTMKAFAMCDHCLHEYENPLDRRFHAQPNACCRCGPEMQLRDRKGRRISCEDEVREAAGLLREGKILAIKGIGGYHLVCNAADDLAVSRLRQQKNRPDKPFALMAEDQKAVAAFCRLDKGTEKYLCDYRRPIVLLEKRQPNRISSGVAPGQRYFGVMLPYTPIHHLLLKDSGLVLVATSGNLSEEPIVFQDSLALESLSGAADYFLVHNRPIHIRCDDSVVKLYRDQEYVLRRARGYVPRPISLAYKLEKHILACGAQQKCVFALARDDRVFLSQHIGDLDHADVMDFFEKTILHFQRLFSIQPELVAHDLHPEYLSTRYALSLPRVKTLGVQHHHAHVASCMVENRLSSPVIGVVFDGTGYGEDGKLWGGEFFLADLAGYQRLAHFPYLFLPGGEQALREPWRIAAACLKQMYGKNFGGLKIPLIEGLNGKEWALLEALLQTGINCPEACGVGRYFDLVAALLGLRMKVTYEGQAALELEAIADKNCGQRYDFSLQRLKSLKFDLAPVLDGIVKDVETGIPLPIIAAKFHNSLVEVIGSTCEEIRARQGINSVVLTGGVFQNLYLLERSHGVLAKRGFSVYTHKEIPANDGGIALGQVAIANERWKKCALQCP